MGTKLQEVIDEARQLSPLEQINLIRALEESLPARYREAIEQSQTANHHAIPSSIRRTEPATDLDKYTADFWDDESIDELNSFIQQQRAADRLSDQ